MQVVIGSSLKGNFMYLSEIQTPQRFGLTIWPRSHITAFEQSCDPLWLSILVCEHVPTTSSNLTKKRCSRRVLWSGNFHMLDIIGRLGWRKNENDIQSQEMAESSNQANFFYLPRTPKEMVLGDAIFAIEEMMWLKHFRSELCEGCKEIQVMLKRVNEFLDMSGNFSDLIWPALKGKRCHATFFHVKTNKRRRKSRVGHSRPEK